MPYYKKYEVIILGFNGALASAITGALDIFSFTGVSWQRIHGQPLEPRFRVTLASLHGQPILCSNRLILTPHADIHEITHADILLIPTIGGDIDTVLSNNRELVSIIRKFANGTTDIACNCSGAFWVANTGLLDGKVATTHWGYADKFSAMFPSVKLTINKLITQSENIFCAGGGVTFNDLCLMLIERYCGNECANQVAKAHMINRQSDYQATYSTLLTFKEHNQEHIIRVQEYIEAHFAENLTNQKLASIAQCTERTLNRHFNKYVGKSPTKYIQSVRIENAKRLLEQGNVNIKQLAGLVGYDDVPSFGKLFKSVTGFTLAKYRANFQRNFRH